MKRLNLAIEGGPPRSSNAKIDVGHSVSSGGLIRTLKIPTVDIKTAAFKKPRVDVMANVDSTGCERHNRILPSSLGADFTRSRLPGSYFALNKIASYRTFTELAQNLSVMVQGIHLVELGAHSRRGAPFFVLELKALDATGGGLETPATAGRETGATSSRRLRYRFLPRVRNAFYFCSSPTRNTARNAS
jgi:hypothetical protein